MDIYSVGAVRHSQNRITINTDLHAARLIAYALHETAKNPVTSCTMQDIKDIKIILNALALDAGVHP